MLGACLFVHPGQLLAVMQILRLERCFSSPNGLQKLQSPVPRTLLKYNSSGNYLIPAIDGLRLRSISGSLLEAYHLTQSVVCLEDLQKQEKRTNTFKQEGLCLRWMYSWPVAPQEQLLPARNTILSAIRILGV